MSKRSVYLLAGGLGAAAIALAPIGVAAADTGVLTIASTSLPSSPAPATTISVALQSTGSDPLDFSLVVVRRGSIAAPSMRLSDVATTQTPDPDPTVGWSCVLGFTVNRVDCQWNGGGKDASSLATLTVTVTFPGDALGEFDVTAVDNTGPVVLDSGVITVFAAVPTTSTVVPTTSTTTSTTTPADGVVVAPAFTG